MYVSLSQCFCVILNAGDCVLTFAVDILPKLMLVHNSSSWETFAKVVLDYLSSDQLEESVPE